MSILLHYRRDWLESLRLLGTRERLSRFSGPWHFVAACVYFGNADRKEAGKLLWAKSGMMEMPRHWPAA
jgi:hypothetical protein